MIQRLRLGFLLAALGASSVAAAQLDTSLFQPVPTVEVPAAGPGTDTAVPTQEVTSPAAPAHWPDQVLWALAGTQLLEYLKRSKWFPWLSPRTTARIKAQWGFGMALLTAAGIHYVIQGSFFSSDGVAITISGVSFAAFKDLAIQWSSQQGWYQLIVERS